jgi:hypothetical protein
VLGLWTALTLGGSIWSFLVIAGPNSVTRYSNIRLDIISSDNIALLAILTVFLCGGGLWGLGIAQLMKADAISLAKTIMFTWGALLFIVLALVVAGGFSKINVLPIFPHSRHYNFLLIWVPAVGIVTAITAYMASGNLGFKEERKSVGMVTGLAAALGFLSAGLVLPLGFGWEVGGGIPGMLTVFLICSISAALTGGMALGWLLDTPRAGLLRDERSQ